MCAVASRIRGSRLQKGGDVSTEVTWSKARLRAVLAKDPRRKVPVDAGLDTLVDIVANDLEDARARVNRLETPTREFALARIASMADRPFAWAATREAFGLQLVTLVEMVRGTHPKTASQEAMRAVFGAGTTIGEGFDVEWTQQATAAARALVEATP